MTAETDPGATDRQPAPSPTRVVGHRSRDDVGARVVFVPRSARLLALVLVLIVGALLLWSILGTVRTMVAGRAIIVPAGQEVFDVQGTSAGRVVAIDTRLGETVQAGQTLIEIAPPDLALRSQIARQVLADLEADLADYQKRLDEEAKAHEDAARARLAALRTALAAATRQAAAPAAQPDGGAAAADASRAGDAAARAAELQQQIAATEVDLIDYRANQVQLVADREHRIFEQRLTVKDLDAELELAGRLRAPSAGVVQELHVHAGQVVQPGEVLMTIASGGKGYEALAFIAPSQGGRVVTGMEVHILPATVARSEYGLMRGIVASVSPGPVSLAELDTLLGDHELAASFMSEGPPYICHVELPPDPANPSGFTWLSGHGPPFAITPGVLASVEIVVRTQAPITLVMPALRPRRL
jgi:HlyD family secretion protein